MKDIFNILLVSVLVFACQRKVPATATEGTKDTETTKPVTSGGNITGATPSCILRKIDSLKQLPPMNPAAQVDEYEYDGKKVYGFSLGCCDMFYMVYSSSCNYLCAPSGGFTGKGDGKCTDFDQASKKIRTVWKDERARK